MKSVLQPRHKLGEVLPERIAILRALQLGDLLCAVPAFRALRTALPEAHITLIGLPWSRSFVERFYPYFDSLIEFPGYPGFPEQEVDIGRFPDFLKEMQEQKFDLALQMQGSGGISNSLLMLFGAKQNAGFWLPGQYVPDPDRFLAYPVHEPEVTRHLLLMEFLGIPPQGNELEFPLNTEDWEKFHGLQERHDLRSCDFAVIHPGARAAIRRWPAEWFAAVGDGLSERGLRVVITGTAEENEIAEAVAQHMKSPALNLAGQTDLGSLGALLSTSRILVCNDTGVSHMAAGLKTQSVVLFTASDPVRWAPLDRKQHRVVAWATAVMPQVVLEEVDQLLNAKDEDNDVNSFFTSSLHQTVS